MCRTRQIVLHLRLLAREGQAHRAVGALLPPYHRLLHSLRARLSGSQSNPRTALHSSWACVRYHEVKTHEKSLSGGGGYNRLEMACSMRDIAMVEALTPSKGDNWPCCASSGSARCP